MNARAWRADLAIALLVLGSATWWGSYYWRASLKAGRHPFFYQLTYEPAVMLVCGHGFSLAASPHPALQAFLEERVDRFSCDQLPADLSTSTTAVPQITQLYLMSAVALTWRFTGISWSRLAPLFGLLFAAASTCAYGLFRLGMGRVAAGIATLSLALSPLHLLNLPNLLDYAKAPFMLGLLLSSGALVARATSRRAALLLSLAYGVVLGVGYGFRLDVVITIPLFLLALIVFLPGGVRARSRDKITGLIVAALTFLTLASPMLVWRVRAGSCEPHVATLGLSSHFTRALGLEPSIYDWGHLYHDLFAYETITAFAHRRNPGQSPIGFCSPQYDDAGIEYLKAVARTFPADLLIRGYASIIKIAELPFGWPNAPLPDLLPELYRIRSVLLLPLATTGILWCMAAILIAAARSVRTAAFLTVTLLFLGMFPAVQFANRHHFFLEFLTLWAIGFLIAAAARLLTSRLYLIQGRLPPGWRHSATAWPLTTGGLRRAALFATVSAVLLIGPLLALRVWQQREVQRLISGYLSMPMHRLTPTDVPLPTPKTLGTGQPTDLLQVSVDAARCPDGATLTFEYVMVDADEGFFTRRVPIGPQPSATGPTRVLSPVYRGFERVAVEPEDCLAETSRVEAERQPLWVFAILPPTWEAERLYQRLSRFRAPYSID